MHQGWPHGGFGIERRAAGTIPCVSFFDPQFAVLRQREEFFLDSLIRLDGCHARIGLGKLVFVPCAVFDSHFRILTTDTSVHDCSTVTTSLVGHECNPPQ